MLLRDRPVLSEDWTCFPELCDDFCEWYQGNKRKSQYTIIIVIWASPPPHLLLLFFFFVFCNSSYSWHPFEIGKEQSLLRIQKLGLWCSVDAKFPTTENFCEFLPGFVIISGSPWRIAKLWNARHLVPVWKMALLCSLAGTCVVPKRQGGHYFTGPGPTRLTRLAATQIFTYFF